MADILASLAVAIGAETSGLTKGIAIAKKELRGLVNFGASLQDIGRSLSIGLTAPLGLLAGAAIQASGELDGLRRGLSLYVGEGQKLQAELTKLKEVAKLPGLGLKEAIQGSTNLQAAGFSADFARRALVGFGSALASVGKGKVELDRVALALVQINNTPFVQGQDLNQLRQALPQIGAVMKKVFGVTTVEALKEAGVTSKQFIEGITAEFERLPKATGGLKNSLENLSDASTIALDAVGSALDRVFNVQGAADGVYNLATGFAALPPSVQNTTVALGGLAAALGPALVGIGALAKATPLLVNGFALLTSPVGLTVAVLAGGAALIIANWDKVSAYFTTGDGASAFKELKLVAIEAFSAIKSLSAVVTDALRDNWGTIATVVGGALRGVLAAATLALQSLRGAVQGISGLAKGDLSEAAVGFKALAASMVGVTVPAETAADKLARLRVRIKEAREALTELENRRKGQSLSDVTPEQRAETTVYFTPKIEEARKALQALIREQYSLTAAKNETTAADTAATTAADASTTAIKGQSAAAKELADILSAFQKQLLENQRLINAYGIESEFAADRSELLAKGIDTLISKGFAPGGPVVQKYVKELRALNETLRQNIDLTALQGNAVSLAPVKFGAAPGAVSEYKPTEYDNALRKSFEEADKEIFAFEDRLRAFQANAGQIVGAGFADMATAVGVGVGNLMAGLSGFESIPQILLGIVGDMAVNLGKAAIGIGTAMSAIKLSFSNPFTAIAAGVALVALGTAIKGVAGGIVSGGGGGGYSAPSVSSYQSPTPRATAAPIAQTAITHRIELTARGDQLAGVLILATDRFGRVTGR